MEMKKILKFLVCAEHAETGKQLASSQPESNLLTKPLIIARALSF
jgi:hypothetical protein